MRPYQIWRHRLGTPPADDELVFEEPDERFYLDVSSTRSEQWIVLTIEQQDELGGAPDPGRRPDRRAARSCGRGSPDVEYSIDHWGDRFVVLTNLDAPDFRVMTAPLDAPGEWEELLAARARSALHVGRAVRRPPRGARVERRPAEGAGPVPRRARGPASTSAPSRTTSSSVPTRSGTTTSLRVAYQSLTTPATVYDHDVVTGERILRKRTPTPDVDLERYTSERTWATASTAPGFPSTSSATSTRRSTARRRASSTATAPTRRRCRRGSPSARLSLLDRGVTWALVHPRGGGELGRAWYLDGKLLNKRNTFTDTISAVEHVVGRGRGCDPSASPSAVAAPAACSSAPASRCGRTCSPAPSPRSRSSTSSRR